MTSNFYNDLVNFIKLKEGGLTNNPQDTTAAKFPSPTPEKYHTNKGITYKTFLDSAASLKYIPSVQNFLNMPNEIWGSIFLNKYYNKTKNLTDNQILNGFIAYWAWQGWNNKITSVKDVTQILQNKLSNKEKLNALVNLRLNYYRTLSQNNPKYMPFLKGWNNTAKDYQTTFSPYL